MRLSLRWLSGLALVALLTTSAAWAQGRGRGRAAGNNQVWHMGGNNAWGTGAWRGDPWSFGRSRPQGWDRGRKTGWGNCDMPPGQAKKYGCNSNSWYVQRPRRDRSRDWDRDGDWRRDRNRERDWRRDHRYRR